MRAIAGIAIDTLTDAKNRSGPAQRITSRSRSRQIPSTTPVAGFPPPQGRLSLAALKRSIHEEFFIQVIEAAIRTRDSAFIGSDHYFRGKGYTFGGDRAGKPTRMELEAALKKAVPVMVRVLKAMIKLVRTNSPVVVSIGCQHRRWGRFILFTVYLPGHSKTKSFWRPQILANSSYTS